MSAEVIPFPKTKNRPFIHKQAAHAAGMSEKGGNNYLRIQLDKQRDTMEQRGIDPAVIGREIAAMDAAIRAELSHYGTRQPGGAA